MAYRSKLSKALYADLQKIFREEERLTRENKKRHQQIIRDFEKIIGQEIKAPKGWKTKLVYLPTTNETFTSLQKSVSVSNGRMRSSSRKVSEALDKNKNKIKQQLKSVLKKGDAFNIGYQFEMKFKGKKVKNNTGFTFREPFSTNDASLDAHVEILYGYMIQRFDQYLTRDNIGSVNLKKIQIEAIRKKDN